MKKSSIVMLALVAVAVAICVARAADKAWRLPEETSKLEKGEGVELVTTQCSLCHSADYISTQPRMNRAAWTATITKMRDKYGAPVPTNSVDQLVTYLVKQYGTEKSAK
jgi:sulfite dehydrogenase (cytochrome) subunit B